LAAATCAAAQASHAQIYVANSCGSETVKPSWIPLDCPGADGPNLAAEAIAYRTYGRRFAVATATFRVCGGACYSGASPAEEMFCYYKGSFRFSQITRCYAKKGFAKGSRLFYAVTSYKYTDHPWITYSTNFVSPGNFRCPHIAG
jgi:hypothetical protein